MPLEHARRDRLDRLAVGDVALLVLVRVRRRPPREADHVPAARAASSRQSSAPIPEDAPVTTATRIGADASRRG